MLYGEPDTGLGRERRERISREVERNRLTARLAAARAIGGAGLEENTSRESPAAHGVAVVVALLR